ncbi:GNAT family N-acetyltransferase [Candidatus Woesearchaeota archaeon]|jgi:RimJ/RimL family protein N-acetyltransferase|nr:GNAT family N-acetyltransferase [Candidatus Woesearchaeota archaeon]MBT6519063.1 GNAT family N-acetyltransferase [Candidatus Woesearchaeota archaeon]MBT7366873.1 GNAT family N-acetyltransferase [Candidatus Woesearchaeota archaeon]
MTDENKLNYVDGIEIKTKLRPLRIDDLDNCMNWINDSDIIGNFAHFNRTISREEEEKVLEKMIADPNTKTYTIESKEGEYLGSVGLNKIFWPTGESTLSLIIGRKDKWGQGYASSALMQIMDLAFNEYDLHRLEIGCFDSNKRAQKVYSRCGFIQEGTQRQKYMLREEYHDVAMMAILKQDYVKMMEEGK